MRQPLPAASCAAAFSEGRQQGGSKGQGESGVPLRPGSRRGGCAGSCVPSARLLHPMLVWGGLAPAAP